MNKIPKILFLQHFANTDEIAQIVCLCFYRLIYFILLKLHFLLTNAYKKVTQKCLYQLFNKLYSYRIRRKTEFFKISVVFLFDYIMIDEPEFCMETIEILATG
jgi:hypothetical protein